MQTIMVVLLEESEEIQEDLLLVILSILGRNKNVLISASDELPVTTKLHDFVIADYINFFVDTKILGCHKGWEETCYECYRAM